MRWMRWPTSILITLLIPVWLLMLVPKLNGFGPESLKQELSRQNVYEELAVILHQSGEPPESNQVEVTDQAIVVLRSALTPSYLETKSNQVIDQTSQWMIGKSQTEPVLNLNDIKETVLNTYPDAQTQIDELQSSLARAQQELKANPMPVDGIEGLEADGSSSTIEIAKMLQQADSLNAFIAGDFQIKLGQVLTPLKTFYQIYLIAVPVTGVLIIGLLLGFIFSRPDTPSKILGLGWLLIATAIVNGLAALLFSLVILQLGLSMALDLLSGQAEAAGSVGEAVINSLFANYVGLEAIITSALLLLGIALVITAKFMLRKSPTQPATGLTGASPSATTEAELTVQPNASDNQSSK